MVGRAADAAFANFNAVASRENHVHQTHVAQFCQNPSGFVAKSGGLAELAERLPQDLRQEADQDAIQNTILFLMPDRSEADVGLVNSEGCFGFREWDVGIPVNVEGCIVRPNDPWWRS